MPETPLKSPWGTYPTPELLDDLIVEIQDSENTPREFQSLSVGDPYPDPKKVLLQGQDYYFCKTVALSHNRAQFWFSRGEYQNQDLYNYDIDFVSDSADHPIFVRRYLTRRDVRAAGLATVARGAAFTGIFSIYVTNGGTGYDPENPPAVSFAGGTGSGCTATALVTKAGVVQWVRITNEGSGYTDDPPVVTIDPPTAGTTAEATAYMQESTTVLIKQKWNELPTEDPRYSLFLFETRIYQTFPGPVLTEWNFVPRIYRLAKIEKNLVLASEVPSSEYHAALLPGEIIEYQPLTDVYSAKIVTTLPTTGLVWEDGGEDNDVVYSAFINHRFPDQITENPNIYILAAVSDSGKVVIDFAWDCKCDEGYAGPCVAEVRERYTYDPTDAAFIAALPSPTLVIPKAQTVIGGVYRAGGDQPIANLYTVQIPMSLHPLLTIGIIANGEELPIFSGTFVGTEEIPATSPTGFSTGDTLVLVEQPERLGIAGLWMVRIITTTHP